MHRRYGSQLRGERRAVKVGKALLAVEPIHLQVYLAMSTQSLTGVFSRFNTNTYPSLRNAKNHCRNPGGHRPEPWCYTSPHGEEEPCGLKRCPQGTYPSHMDTSPGLSGATNNPSLVDSLHNVWQSLSAQWQLAALSGLGIFAFLILFALICCCCCRKKRRKSSEPTASTLGSSTAKKNGFPVASYAGSGSVVNRYVIDRNG